MIDWRTSLGRELGAEDQGPGFYRFRRRKRAPWQAVRIIWDGNFWHCLVNGVPVIDSGQRDPMLIVFVLWHCPFAPISEAEYDTLLAEYANARPGSPLLRPDDPVDLRGSAPL